MQKLGIVAHKSYCDCLNLPLFDFAHVPPNSVFDLQMIHHCFSVSWSLEEFVVAG